MSGNRWQDMKRTLAITDSLEITVHNLASNAYEAVDSVCSVYASMAMLRITEIREHCDELEAILKNITSPHE